MKHPHFGSASRCANNLLLIFEPWFLHFLPVLAVLWLLFGIILQIWQLLNLHRWCFCRDRHFWSCRKQRSHIWEHRLRPQDPCELAAYRAWGSRCLWSPAVWAVGQVEQVVEQALGCPGCGSRLWNRSGLPRLWNRLPSAGTGSEARAPGTTSAV